MGKKGVSPVVATVLIITLTVVTIGIIAPTVIKFTNENLDKSKECFDIMEDIKLEDLGYTCTTNGETSFSFRIHLYKYRSFSSSNCIFC
ncbi:TPA: type IV pilin [Candidatus Pacearchaeota archaeon]|nr:type IV pilin [Candidatus Pacearchaeota archaeon]